jgi:uncharacterized protein with PIN domain
VDINVGKLARWLRMLGYDTLLFDHGDDSRLIKIALTEGRVLLTKDTHIMERGVITSGRLRAILIAGDEPVQQVKQVIDALGLDGEARPFSLCMECNAPLEDRSKQAVADLVPPYVLRTQDEYVQCPACRRVYWKGTHWQAMMRRLEALCELTGFGAGASPEEV